MEVIGNEGLKGSDIGGKPQDLQPVEQLENETEILRTGSSELYFRHTLKEHHRAF